MLDQREIGPDITASATQEAALRAQSLSHACDGIPFETGDDIPVEPLLFSGADYERHTAVVRRFDALLQRAAWQDHASPASLRDALTRHPGRYELITSDIAIERTWASCMYRVDAIVSEGRLRILESNVGGAIGGVSMMHMLVGEYRRRGAGMRGRVHFDDPLDARRLLYEDACCWAGGPPSVALLATRREALYAHPRYWSVETDFMAAHGVEAVFQEPEQLAEARSGRFPAALRHFMPEEWRQMGIDLSYVRRAMSNGTLMLAPESSFLMQNKKLLAWLSAGAADAPLSDREFLAAHLPWTRVVVPEETEFMDETWYLPELLQRHQRDLVLKPTGGYGGYGVLVGRFAETGQWLAAASRALESDGEFIVQEYAEPDTAHIAVYNRVDGRARRVEVAPVLGFAVFGGRSAGCSVRFSLGSGTGVVNAAQGACRTVAGWHAD